MDIQREGAPRKKTIRVAVGTVICSAVIALGGWRVSQIKPAAPSVELATIWPDAVKRGLMVREVRGTGTLIAEDIRWIQAAFDSQVSKILAQSGDDVQPGIVLLLLTNPQMEADAVDYEWQTKQAEAHLADLRVKLQSQTFDQQSAVATSQGDLKQAEISRDKEEELYKARLEPEVSVKLAVAKWEQAAIRYRMERQKLDILKESVEAQIEAQRVQIEKLRAMWLLKKKQVDELTIRAGVAGRVQEMTLEAGQRVKPGDVLAKVAPPGKLMARLQIAETQVKDILIGQRARIDTRNGVVPGRVIRIDASVVNGTRTVDCKLEGPLPAGAVPDLSVDGTVEIERLPDVLYVGRPVFAQPNSAAALFKIDPDGKGATRVPVKFGRASVNAIEVLDGLKAGDRVILSDMSAQDRYARVRLN